MKNIQNHHLENFTNLNFPLICGFLFLSYIVGAQGTVWGTRYNLTRFINQTSQSVSDQSANQASSISMFPASGFSVASALALALGLGTINPSFTWYGSGNCLRRLGKGLRSALGGRSWTTSGCDFRGEAEQVVGCVCFVPGAPRNKKKTFGEALNLMKPLVKTNQPSRNPHL